MRIPSKLSLAALGTAMLAGGAFGYTLFSTSTSGAQTTTTVPAAGGTTTPSAGGFHSNEDPMHEQGESAQREAQENAGQAPTAP